MNDLAWLVEVSNALGKEIGLVQGTGGNISVKNGRMMVKSSGMRLSEMTGNRGYISVEHRKITADYHRLSEVEAHEKIMGSFSEDGKPSIETAFHAFLKKYVIHLHPVSANVILCGHNSRKILGEIFESFLWIPYRKVGHRLALEISTMYEGQEMIFLENHGIIISSDSPDCIRTVHEIIGRINVFLSQREGFRTFNYVPLKLADGGFVGQYPSQEEWLRNFLFPDAAVFSLSDKVVLKDKRLFYNNLSFEAARNIDEVLSAHFYLHEMVDGKRLLTEEEVAELMDMPLEKYRRKLLGV